MNIIEQSIIELVYKDIKAPIQLCMDNNYEVSALKLMYSAIDAFVKLALPENTKNDRYTYAAWCDKYLKLRGKDHIKGIEWFGARSGLLHHHMAESDLSRDGQVRMIGYCSAIHELDIFFNENESKTLVIVRIQGLIEAFYKAIDNFIIDLYAEMDHSQIEKRYNLLFSNS